MQINRTVDYGVRVMIHLAGLPAGTRSICPDLAAAADVPPSFMSKILRRLVNARLINSGRGIGGGFELARPASQITLLDVVQAIDGPICLNICLQSGNMCNRSSWCAAHLVWAEAQRKLEQVLGAAVLDKMAKQTHTMRSSLHGRS